MRGFPLTSRRSAPLTRPLASTASSPPVPPPAPWSFSVAAADFNGTDTAFVRNAALSGITNSKRATISAWIAPRAIGNRAIYRANDLGIAPLGILNSTNLAVSSMRNGPLSANQIVLLQSSATAMVADGIWRHVLISWDLAAGLRHLYLNDVADRSGDTVVDSAPSATSHTAFGIGRVPGSTSGRYNGGLAEIYFNFEEYIDLSVEANRRKFISAEGEPVSLGEHGELPTGSPPISYHHLQVGDPPEAFGLNRGTGGDFDPEGAMALYSTSPALP